VADQYPVRDTDDISDLSVCLTFDMVVNNLHAKMHLSNFNRRGRNFVKVTVQLIKLKVSLPVL